MSVRALDEGPQWLPSRGEDALGAPWEVVAEWFDELERSRVTRASAPEWLQRWSRVEDVLEEARHLALIDATADTRDRPAQDRYLAFFRDVRPRLAERRGRLIQRLFETGYSSPSLDYTMRRFESDLRVHHSGVTNLVAETENLSRDYQAVMGQLTASWQGTDVPLAALLPALESPDRSIREAAFRADGEALAAVRAPLNELFDRLLSLRGQLARATGFASFHDFAFCAYHRMDYRPADVTHLRRAIRGVVVPALARIYAARRRALGVATLRPWDLRAPVDGGDTMRLAGPLHEMPGRTLVTIRALEPSIGRWFGRVLDAGAVDLLARPGKAPGAYCAALPLRGVPFLFLNASGRVDDAMTLLHEAGHALHEIAAQPHPLFWQRQVAMEAAELASTTLEILVLPHLDTEGGLLDRETARRARRAYFEDVLMKLAHVASVDHFQEWVYRNPDMADSTNRDAVWAAIRQRYEPEVDWSGLESYRPLRWYRQTHIFRHPLNYIEYAIAQLGALQVWADAQEMAGSAVTRYRRALSLGATVGPAAVYRAAGADLLLDRRRIASLISRVEDALVSGTA